jgi:hypothetical protein
LGGGFLRALLGFPTTPADCFAKKVRHHTQIHARQRLTSLEDFRSLRAIPDTAIRPFHIFANHFFQDIEVARGGAEIAKFPIYGFWGNRDKAEAIQFDSPVSADI